jgi:amino acid transporter
MAGLSGSPKKSRKNHTERIKEQIVSAYENPSELTERFHDVIIGTKKSIEDPSLFHKIALIPLLAWVGLGADGLSSSSYGPAEAFSVVGSHTYILLLLVVATACTVFVISYTYSRIIENFPGGGGGYIVATHTLGQEAGVISGSALIVDYMLTITVSIAACAAALFSFIPVRFDPLRIYFAAVLIIILIIMNMRGVKESVTFLAPIFLTFIIMHALLLGYGIFSHTGNIAPVADQLHSQLSTDLAAIGLFGICAIFFKAYSYGAGTYTGLEAVANGLPIMKEPRVKTGKRTMVYMAVSLAFVAGGLLICYLLWDVHFVPGMTLNAVLAGSVFSSWPFGGLLALITILSEAALLMVGAQAGFIDGPRVMATMATDSWLPRRFASLSERFTIHDGILLMGGAALILLFLTGGSITALVTLYAINVFVTFTLSNAGMTKFFFERRSDGMSWRRRVLIHGTGALLSIVILVIIICEKIFEGAWLTLIITGAVIGLCYMIHGHYRKVKRGFESFRNLEDLTPSTGRINREPVDRKKKTAVQLVADYNGFGIHTFYSIIQNFPGVYENIVFLSVAVIDSGSFKGVAEVDALRDSVNKSLRQYEDLARSFGYASETYLAVGTDVVQSATDLCQRVARIYPDATFFTGQIVFQHEHPFHKILHNETAFAIQRRLHYSGLTTIILPVKVRS